MAARCRGPTVTIVAVANQKGGVGKTATVANLGAALADAGRSTLLIDLDPQASLSLSCGAILPDDRPGAYDVLMDPSLPAADAVIATAWDHLDILPTSESLVAAQVQLADAPRRNQRLRAKLRAAPGHEFALIDTPPSLGFLTLNALTAADWVLIPLQASFLALHGLRRLTETVSAVQTHGNPSLHVGGVLLTMYDTRTLHAREVRDRVREHFGKTLFDVVVRRSVAFDYATVAGEPLVFHQPKHPCALAYRELAQEVILRA